MEEFYLDYAATTPMRDEAVIAMCKFFSEEYGNPGSFHSKGLAAKEALDDARKKVSLILGCTPDEIVFTGGGTESINMALKGIALSHKEKGNHIITSTIEHHAVLNTCEFLERQGYKVTYLPVDNFGMVKAEDVEKAITPETILISIMYANNEIGTIEPIAEIGKIASKHGIVFHTDACQAAGALELDVRKLHVDLLTLNGSKVYGPKGVGLLYVRKGIEIEPLIHGGGQEMGLRSGTENVPLIIGFTKALELGQREKEWENRRLIKLRDNLINGLMKIPKSRLNGHPAQRLPNNVNITFLDVEGEAMLLYLNEQGIFASTGSACASKSLETSHVLRAIGLPYEASHGSMRFTLGRETDASHIDYVIRVMPEIVEKLKKISPVNLDMEHFK